MTSFWPYVLHVAFYCVLRASKSNGLVIRAMRTFQRQAGLIMHLNRQAIMVSALSGVPHTFFSASRFSGRGPLFLYSVFLAYKAVYTALKPYSLRANVVLSLLMEYPLCFLLARYSGMNMFHSCFQVMLRPLVTLIVVYLRRKVCHDP